MDGPRSETTAPAAAPRQPPFWLALVGAASGSLLFILWVRNQWGGAWATTVFVDLASIAVPAGAALACFERSRRGGADLRTAWRLIGAGALAWALGQTAWTVTEMQTGAPPGTPSAADVGYLLFIPLATWGVSRFVRRDGLALGHLRALLDGAIIGSSFIFIAFVFGLEAIVLSSQQADRALIVNLLYPFGDALILGLVLLRLSRAQAGEVVPLALLSVGFILLAVADLWFLVVDAEGMYDTGGILDAFWIMGFQLIGLAAVRPRNLAGTLPVPHQTVLLALLPLYPFALAAIAACYADVRDGFLSDTLFWTALVVVVLVLARLLAMLLDNVQLTARAREAAEALRHEKAVRVRMMNAITHDMLNAMSPIRLQIHMLQQGMVGQISDKQSGAIAMVSRNAEQMARLASDIKEGSNVEEGRLAIRVHAMDLAATVRDAAKSRQPEATQRGVTLQVEAPPELGWTGDAGRLTQVVDNLISNALKFTPRAGRIAVTVAIEGGGAMLRVADTGRGLSKEEQGRLFQPYSQVHDVNEIKEHGTGLGLFISRGIVERHGGRIWVESAGHGHGATFCAWLPTPATDSANAPPRSKATPAAG